MNKTLRNVVVVVALILVAGLLMNRCDGPLGNDHRDGGDHDSQMHGGGLGLNSGASAGITVQATGVAMAVPDAVSLSFTVSVLADSSEAALAAASAASDKVRSAITDNGVDKKDIATQTVSVYPEYTYPAAGGQTLSGYRASQSFTVVVHKADSAGSVVDAVVAAGGDAVQINGATPIILETSDSAKKARADAVDNALAKAEDYAKLMGVDLGDVISITEISAPVSSGTMAKSDMMAGATPTAATQIDLGEQQITVTIEVRWGLN